MSLNKLKEEIAKKNIEVLAITKDLEEWEMKRSGLSGKPWISNMKRKTTISPSNKNKVEINQEPFSKKFSQGGIKVAEVNSNKFKNGIKIKHKTSQERKTNHIGEPLSILKEESELEETKNQR